jgi:hypothetical protein
MPRVLLAALAIMVAPLPATAQFTTFVPPKREAPAPSADSMSVAQARADSTAKQTLTDMRTWVDSALIAAGTTIDTALADSILADTAAAVEARVEPRPAATYSSAGEVAPDTATSKPLLGAIFIGLIGLGAAFLRKDVA